MNEGTSSESLTLVTRADRLGVGVSAVCVMHCLAFPIMLALLPFWPALEVFHGWSHLVFALFVAPISLVAMRKGFELHATAWIPTCIGAGAFLIFAALFVGHAWLGVAGEMLLTVLGSGLLIFGHLQNSKRGRRCAPCESSCKVC